MSHPAYVSFSEDFMLGLDDCSDAEFRAAIDYHCQENRRRRLLREEIESRRASFFRSIEARDGIPQCTLCGSYDRIVIDHILPVCRGGTNNLDNLQFLCQTCNRDKGAQ